MHAFREVLKNYTTKTFTDDEIFSTIGMTWVDYTNIFLPGADTQTLESFKADFAESENHFMDIYAKPYDGVPELLKALKSKGYLTAVCSNSSARYITRVLKTLGLFELIDEIAPLQPGMTKRETLGILLEKVKPCRAVMVGDRIYDMQAAEHNGIGFVGCRYGYGKNELDHCENLAEKADELLKKIEGLMQNV